MDIQALYNIYLNHPKISTDTRTDLCGCIYFALKGTSFNGNDFAASALEKGAVYCIIDDPKACIDPRTILVENVLQTLQQLASFHRKKVRIPVLAITGTNGKTTTKELIQAILSTTFRTSCTKGNLNNHIGVPLTLLSIPEKSEIAIVEMGANHPGEIEFLCRIADPDFGLITNIGKAHLEGFGGFEGVVQTKTELYRYLENKSGTVFINGDDELLMREGRNIRQIIYGKQKGFYLQGTIEQIDPVLSVKFLMDDKFFTIKTHLIGSYNLYNILAAICVGKYFNVSTEHIIAAIQEFKPDNMRSQIEKCGSNTVILDTYNANPSSMEAALDNFFLLDAHQKMVILGDMLELGEWSGQEHEKIVHKLIDQGIKAAWFIGKNFDKIKKPAGYLSFSDTETVGKYLQEHPIKDYFVLLKGSRGIKLEHILKFFSDEK